ncbi:MAG: hypothetical protein AAGI88_02525 [Pseudomonadota bacterium]
MQEVYKERYATYRHLDQLRWQMLQLAVAAGSAVLAFADVVSETAAGWKWAVAGSIFLILGIAMLRIGAGIVSNAKVLREVGKEIGDVWIPQPSPYVQSVSFWIALAITVFGGLCLVTSIVKYFC